MKLSQNSSFIKYDLTADEFLQGTHFSLENRAVMQNLIADFAEEKIGMTYDPEHPLQFQQAEAELQGKIGILKYLLSLEAQSKPEVN